jgi:hypothetical protein
MSRWWKIRWKSRCMEKVIYDSMFETDKGVGGGTQRRNSDQVDQRR